MNRRLALLMSLLGAFLVVVIAINAITLTTVARASNNISTLLTNGKTASAQSAAQAKKNSAAAEVIIQHVENQLTTILANSKGNRQLICVIAQAAEKVLPLSSASVAADCAAP
jgi:hypothetical protein